MNKHLVTIYTRSPLHVGSGSSVDVVDLPIMRERITAYPVIPSTSLKGVLLQYSREKWADSLKKDEPHKDSGQKMDSSESVNHPKDDIPRKAKILFGYTEKDKNKNQISVAGCVQIMEAKILAFPVRSLSGCFAWITCPLALERFNRDTGKNIKIPEVNKDHAIAGQDVIVNNSEVVLEEYALKLQPNPNVKAEDIAKELKGCSDDPVWNKKLESRLVIVNDENFQHFVTTCTEVNTRIAIDPKTRTNTSKALFNQENVPSESLFYSVLTVLPARGGTNSDIKQEENMEKPEENMKKPEDYLNELFESKPLILQIGGDETTGFGLCEIKKINL
jgi:CRISPR-associated protein Cmr4